ncbi:MAG: EF-hand domain-containing protein [Proteobacteria bacterium]|uniref:EF-hand domain-containing protein n=1 Tax=Rudaea sp. TaxID=2136325 RepID=UPI0032206708|nr:EF-hand domain-containing protein [Pseudomonadota bacterium]
MTRITSYALAAALVAAPFAAFAQAADTPAPAAAAPAHPSPFAHMLKKMDSDGDGRISSAEFQAAAAARFAMIDTQGSGKITAAQIAAAGRGRDEKFAEREVKKIGSDGTITKDQYLAAAQARFARLDKNGDGYITADEVPAGQWGHGHGGKNTAQPQ